MAVADHPFATVTQHTFTFVGEAITGGRVEVEHRNPDDLAHGRHAHYAHLALMTAAPETVVSVQFTRADVDLGLRVLHRCRPGFAAHHRATQRRGGDRRTGRRRRTEEAAATQAAFFQYFGVAFCLVTHALLLWGRDLK